ncbi:Argininosuccinate lyase 1 [compost metagenome]
MLRTATPNVELAVKRAGEDFSTATGLADLIVREADLSFREAHHIVGGVVRMAMDAGLPAHRIDTAMVDVCAIEQLGHALNLAAQKVSDCLDPTTNVQARTSAGGPSLSSLKPSLLRANTRIATERQANQTRRDRLTAAHDRLQAATRAQAGL